MDFTIITDTFCDFPEGQIALEGIEIIPKGFSPDDATSVVPMVAKAFEAGLDVLYIGASNLVSPLYDAVSAKLDELSESVSPRRAMHVDSLSLSVGEGSLVSLAASLRAAGKSIDEVRRSVLDTRMHIASWFTAAAETNRLIGMKPLSHVANGGNVIAMDKARGSAKSLAVLVDKMDELGDKDACPGRVFIVQADAEDDAKALAALVKERLGMHDVPVIAMGTSSSKILVDKVGTGCLGLTFPARKR